MKRDIATHEKHLKNMEYHKDRLKEDRDSIQERINRSQQDINFLFHQVIQAKVEKKDGFDCERYKIKDKVKFEGE